MNSRRLRLPPRASAALVVTCRLCPALAAFAVTPLLAQQPLTPPPHFQKLAHTYSIVAWDSVTGDLGVVVESKFPNVGGIVPWGIAGVGAVVEIPLKQ